MSEVALLLLQVSTSMASPPANAGEILLHPVPEAACRPSANEITVCAKSPDTYRLPKGGPSTDPATTLPQAEWRLFGNTKMNVHASQRSLPQGASVPAAMVTIKMPF
ncbi:hypothetical protein [Sphingomonas sp. PR090111-T3T-6A]|uniref:hypothetical protein n=1 Tax=Sphingomonas sp. PR090111-T3T-6A TaxID=685778 RepID=UPI000364538C|nr:hypothetical protein [Sphingomonas sp. PR090111-T3T-6A]